MRDLGELLDRQYAVQRCLEARLFDNNPEARAAYMRDMTLATVVELVELLNETGWKPWSSKRGIVSHEKYVGEMADVVIFVMNLMLFGGVTADELGDAVIAKQKINLERRASGYAG